MCGNGNMTRKALKIETFLINLKKKLRINKKLLVNLNQQYLMLHLFDISLDFYNFLKKKRFVPN